MTDTQTLRDMQTGLKSRKQQLEADEKVFLKVSGLNEEIEKAGQDRETYREELKEAKDRQTAAKMRKAGAVASVVSQIADKMNEVLPFGQAVFNYDEDEDGKRSMTISWMNNGKTTPYNGLSGGEKQIFDAALAHVLDADIIVVEAAELDQENFDKTLVELAKLDKQCIVNTCHEINLEFRNVPEPFQIVEV